MRHEFDKRCFSPVDELRNVETHTVTCAVELEPDDDGTYYIDRVFIEGALPGETKLTFHAVPKDSPLFILIAEYAYTYRRDELDELWEEWLAEHPRARQLRSDAEREHRTHGGRL